MKIQIDYILNGWLLTFEDKDNPSKTEYFPTFSEINNIIEKMIKNKTIII